MKKKYLIVGISVILSIIVEGLISFVRVPDLYISPIIGFVIFFSLPILFEKFLLRENGVQVSIGFCAGLILLFLPFIIFFYNGVRFSILDMGFHFSGAFFSVLFFISKSKVRLILPIAGLFFAIFISFFDGYLMWVHKLKYGTYTGKINSDIDMNLFSHDISESDKSIDSNRLVVLHFYKIANNETTFDFDGFKGLYDKYSKKNNVEFRVVLSKDTFGVFEYVRENKIPAFVPSNQNIYNISGISNFPTTLIIENGKILFRGDVDFADKTLAGILL